MARNTQHRDLHRLPPGRGGSGARGCCRPVPPAAATATFAIGAAFGITGNAAFLSLPQLAPTSLINSSDSLQASVVYATAFFVRIVLEAALVA